MVGLKVLKGDRIFDQNETEVIYSAKLYVILSFLIKEDPQLL